MTRRVPASPTDRVGRSGMKRIEVRVLTMMESGINIGPHRTAFLAQQGGPARFEPLTQRPFLPRIRQRQPKGDSAMLIRLIALGTALSLASASNAQAQVFDPFYGGGYGKSVNIGVGVDHFGGKSVVVGVNKGFRPNYGHGYRYGFDRGFHHDYRYRPHRGFYHDYRYLPHRGFHPGFHPGFRGGFRDPFCHY